MKYKHALILCSCLFLSSCMGSMNPTGGNSAPDYPYFITTQPIVVKHLNIPVGSKLIYKEQFFRSGQQAHRLSEKDLIGIEFPANARLRWGGIPISSIRQFFNSEMRGFSIYADFDQLSTQQRGRFIQLWQSCNDGLAIDIINTQDWSFNQKNISDVESCSVNYQRYFKNDHKQQQFLDDLYSELKRVATY